MAYILTLGGDEHRAEIDEIAPGRYDVKIGNKTFRVDARRTAGDLYSLLVEHEVLEADLEWGQNGDLTLLIRGEVFHVHAIDERRKKLRAAAGAGTTGGGKLTTPMPGKVVRILCKPGAKVKQGQGIVVVEAMKMENEMTASADGVVKEICVEEGQAVDSGAVLAVIE